MIAWVSSRRAVTDSLAKHTQTGSRMWHLKHGRSFEQRSSTSGAVWNHLRIEHKSHTLIKPKTMRKAGESNRWKHTLYTIARRIDREKERLYKKKWFSAYKKMDDGAHSATPLGGRGTALDAAQLATTMPNAFCSYCHRLLPTEFEL